MKNGRSFSRNSIVSSRIFSMALSICLAFAFSFSSSVAQETETSSESFVKDISIGKTVEINSKVLSEKRTLMISLPRSYQTGQRKYPVLYLLDGRDNFLHTTATATFLAANRKIPEVIIVGIVNTNRTRDLTPPSKSESDKERFADLGGADHFHKFIQTELIPFVDKKYRTSGHRTLIGHSFGGLFIFHLLEEHPGAFDAYLAISPSLWWNDMGLVSVLEERLKKAPGSKGRLFFTLGNEKGKMLEGFQASIEIFEKHAPEPLKWSTTLLDDETHLSVPLRSTYHGLPFILKGVKAEKVKTEPAKSDPSK